MTSYVNFTNVSTPGPTCETDPNGEDTGAYNLMKGLKKDATPFVIPPGGSAAYVTKFVYSGDPETGNGWTEGSPGSPTGSVWNCGGPGHYTGDVHSPNAFGDRRFVMSSGSDSYTVNPGDTNKIYAVQLIAQGTSRLNSVTRLKQLADYAQAFYNGGFVIGIRHDENQSLAHSFAVYPNYPNPFNPTTNIKYQIANNSFVQLKIFDVLGREVATLVNEKLQPGTYTVDWDAANYPSGVYFYKFTSSDAVTNEILYTKTNKMILMK
jgi:hypothetical protein